MNRFMPWFVYRNPLRAIKNKLGTEKILIIKKGKEKKIISGYMIFFSNKTILKKKVEKEKTFYRTRIVEKKITSLNHTQEITFQNPKS